MPLVHNNPTLSCIQKFNYLKSQLQEDAARAIAGLTLTEQNYQHSIERLAEICTTPQADQCSHASTANPSSSLNSLRLFYDTIATHTRALGSLGKELDGDLLVSVILKGLPVDVKRISS